MMTKIINTKFMKNAPSDCVICALKPFLILSCFKIKCEHIGVKNVISFEKSICRRNAAIFVNFLIGLCALSYVYLLYTVDFKKSPNSLLIFIMELVFAFNGFGVHIFSLSQYNTKFQMFSNWSLLCNEVKNKYGFRDILDSASIQKLRIRNYFFLAFLIIVTSTNIILSIFCDYGYGLKIFRLIPLSYAVIVQIYIISVFSQNNKVLLFGYESVKKEIEMHLNLRKLNAEMNVSKKLAALGKFSSQLYFNFRLLDKIINPVFLMWQCSTVLVMILNAYQTLHLEYFPQFRQTLWMLHFRNIILYVCCTYVLWIFEEPQHASEDILSFLFKYPISKLTAAEAAQVEVLITTLTVQKPVIRASDVFVVGTRLLASISGTVVTYVLVALQFHATWTQE